jgi:hypothetical protein
VFDRRVSLLAAVLLACPSVASAFTVATDQATGEELSWDNSGPLNYRLHEDFGGGIPPLRAQGLVRKAFETWTVLPGSDVEIEEEGIFRGLACPHDLGDDVEADPALVEAICNGALPDADGDSVIHWIETIWPFQTEVIALTTLSWTEGAELVDADISLNGVVYEWTTGDTNVKTDFSSILIHEIGHYFGLAHSDAAEAVMRIDYNQGDIKRTLGQDDAEGLAHLYPCGSGDCSTEVGFEQASCSLSGGVGPLAAFAGLLVLLGLLRGRARAAVPLLALMLLPATADTSVVVALDGAALAQKADAVVRAHVTGVESELRGVVWSDIRLDVDEVLAGDAPTQITLSQPGGRTEGFGTRVFGMPDFAVGEEVVVFVEFSDFGARVVGLAQGKAQVGEGGALMRDLSGLALARMIEPGPVLRAELPPTLDGLRAQLR